MKYAFHDGSGNAYAEECKFTVTVVQKEKPVALSGTGRQSHAHVDHAQHEEYARRTLLAYCPCLGVQGTDGVVELVRSRF